MTLALTALGLQVETFDEIRDAINAKLTRRFGPIDLSDESIEGQLVAIIAERLASGDALLLRVYSSWDPDAAGGTALDSICSITGTLRTAATKSAVILTFAGTDTTLVPALHRVRNPDSVDGDEWETLADDTIAALAPWVGSTAYALDDRVTNSGNAYVCITDGVSDSSGGPSTSSSDITDGTAHWKFIIEGTAIVDIVSAATVTGPITAAAGSLTELIQPLFGIDDVVNIEDAAMGSDVMSDAILRMTRVIELQSGGSGTIGAIRSSLRRKVTGVTSVSVFENNTEATNSDGMPPKTVEALVAGGADQDICNALINVVAGGILTHGTETGSAIDANGDAQVIKFSRAEELDAYVKITVTKDRASFPNDGEDQIKAAIVLFGQRRLNGGDVVPWAIGASVKDVPGIINVTEVLVSIEPVTVPVASVVIPITKRQRAVYDSSRIVVVLVDGEL